MGVLTAIAVLVVVLVGTLVLAVGGFWVLTTLWSRSFQPTGRCAGQVPAPKRSVLITGGNCGLGYETARKILLAPERGYHVTITCRDESRAEAAIARLKEQTGNPNVGYKMCDLASLSSVKSFLDALELPFPMEALVLNAAAHGSRVTTDGFDSVFQIAHLSHFLIARSLAPKLPDGGRIVWVASDMHDPPHKSAFLTRDPADMAVVANSSGAPNMDRYCYAKLCNVMTAYEMAERYSRLRVNAFNPGLCLETQLSRSAPPSRLAELRFVIAPMCFVQGRLGSVWRSAATVARLVWGEVATTGCYVDQVKVAPSSALSREQARWKRLWNVSEDLLARKVD